MIEENEVRRILVMRSSNGGDIYEDPKFDMARERFLDWYTSVEARLAQEQEELRQWATFYNVILNKGKDDNDV